MESIRTHKASNQPRKVVFVDDDPDWKDAFQHLLKEEHMDVKSFTSGEAALEFLEHSSEQPDLIILDIDLKIGGMSGVEVAHRLRTQRLIHTPILFLSAEPHLDIWKQQIPFSRSLSKRASFRKILNELVNDPILMN